MANGRILLVTLLLFLGCFGGFAVARGDEPWLAKPPSAWTLDDAEAVLWKSPWARQKVFRYFNAQGNERRATFSVRLQSALPVRLAIARAFKMQPETGVVLAGTPDFKGIEELAHELELPGEIVLAMVAFPPSIHRRLDDQRPSDLKGRTWLSIGGQEHIPLAQFVPPRQSTFGEAWFRFPRPAAVAQKGKLHFSTELAIPHKIHLEVEFDLEKLTFEQSLAF